MFLTNYYHNFRLIRCDGTLLVCMSSLSAYIRKGTISEYDLLESPHKSIHQDLYNAIRDYYPPGSTISSLARNLVSVGNTGTAPDPNSKIYYVPKVCYLSWFLILVDHSCI